MRERESVIRIVALVLLLYSLLTALSARMRLGEAEAYVAQLKAEQSRIYDESRRLASQLDSLSDDEALEKLARERLGLVMPDETIFYFNTDREEQK